MKETLEIGPVPSDEECAQVGSPDYEERALAECQKFRECLMRYFGTPPEGARLVITRNPHDFGTYYEVAVKYDTNNEKACEYAYKVEGEAPTKWRDYDYRGWASL